MAKSEKTNKELKAASDTTLKQLGVDQTTFRKVTFDFIRCADVWSGLRDGIASYIGVTGPQYSMLTMTIHPDWPEGLTVKNLATMMGVTGPFITREAGVLIKKGLLKKVKNGKDKRSVYLLPTDHGMRTMHKAMKRLRFVNALLFLNFDSDKYTDFMQMIDDLKGTSEKALQYLKDEGKS
jgi:MarR family transcriptional regulator, organic hydroperoxide resistance regulator